MQGLLLYNTDMKMRRRYNYKTLYRTTYSPRLRASLEAKLAELQLDRHQSRRVIVSLGFLSLATLAIALGAFGLLNDNNQAATATNVTEANTTVTEPASTLASASSPTLRRPQANYSKVIGFVGDSLTRGCCQDATPAPTLEAKLLGDGYTAINRGVDGSTTAHWLDQLLEPALAEFKQAKVEVVQVMLGTNDILPVNHITVDQYVTNMHQIIARLQANGAKVIILNKPPYAVERKDADIQAIRQALATTDWGEGVYIGDDDAYDHFRSHPELLADGLHMNQQGYNDLAALWAEAYWRVMNQLATVAGD